MTDITADNQKQSFAVGTRDRSVVIDGLSKIPEVTVGFWIIKIIATTLGEAGGNALSLTLDLGYATASLIFGLPLILAAFAQIRAKKFNRFLYWTVITLTTLAGTTLADFFDRSLGIGYAGGSLSLFALVMISLTVWHKTTGSVNIATITNPKTEAFYWITIMFSQTLGTALGDWLADATPLGYRGSAVLIGSVLAALGLLYYFTKCSRTTLFWSAFILTRPLGAVLDNCFDKPIEKGSMGISDITLSAVLTAMMLFALLVIPQRASSKH